MSNCPRLILVGVPGVGKSTVAALLSQRLKLPVVETDAMVAQVSGVAEDDALVLLGEEKFRELEAQASRDGLGKEGILVLGSGAVLDSHTRELVKTSGVPVFWLQASLAAISPRVGLNRPHPASMGLPRAMWKQLEAEREALYREVATHEVDTSTLDAGQVCDQISEALVGSV